MFHLIRFIAASAVMFAWFRFTHDKSWWVAFVGVLVILGANDWVKQHINKKNGVLTIGVPQ
jgi:hypothetical protein